MPKTERVPCNFCRSDSGTIVYSEGTLKLVRCRRCGFHYVNPRIHEDDLMAHYDEDHTCGTEVARRKLKNAGSDQKVVTDQTNWTKEQWAGLAGWLAQDFRLIARHHAPGRILDVGCSDGERLAVAFQNGWKDIYGIELSDAAIDRVKATFNLPDNDKRFKNCTIRQCGFPDNFFDVITYWSVLEHVTDPLENLMVANRLLKQGGIIVIRVPNVREEFLRKYVTNLVKFFMPAGARRKFGMRDERAIAWKEVFDLSHGTSGAIGGLELELHLNHFSDATLKMFLEQSGFCVLMNGSGEEPLILQENNIKSFVQRVVRSMLSVPYYATFRKRFNVTQQLLFVAQKRTTQTR